jgi:septum formation protein
MRIILGSASTSRQEIFRAMGFDFEVLTANINEKAIRLPDPRELVLAIATAKADALLKRVDDNTILVTCDQVVAVGSEIHEKPSDLAEAERFIRSNLITPPRTVSAVVVSNTKNKKQISGVDEVTIRFHQIPDDVIASYLATGDALKRAGGFAIEHPIIAPYVESISGELESVRGLPVALTKRLLAEVQA